VAIDFVKVVNICDWPTSYSHIDMQVFLRFTNFYHRFIHGFSDIACSLFNIISAKTTWIWGLDQQYTFTTLKIAIIIALVLALSDVSALLRVKADNLDFAIRVVLS